MCIRDSDRPALFQAGVKAIFGPGTSTEEMVAFIETAVERSDAGVGGDTDWHWTGLS